jgi:hypothetical protein
MAIGHDIIVYANKVYLTFSLSGTYFVHSYDKTKLLKIEEVYSYDNNVETTKMVLRPVQ